MAEAIRLVALLPGNVESDAELARPSLVGGGESRGNALSRAAGARIFSGTFGTQGFGLDVLRSSRRWKNPLVWALSRNPGDGIGA
jgi:hypothetical protein